MCLELVDRVNLLNPFLSMQVVDTSELIQNEESIFSTQWIACLAKDQQEMKIAQSSTTNNLLTRIFRERTFFREAQKREKAIVGTDRCILDINESAMGLASSQIFVLASEVHLAFMVAFSEGLNIAKSLWISNEPVHEFSLVFYYNQRNSFNRDYFHRL